MLESDKKSSFWLQLFIIVALLPLSLGAVDYTGKPLDFVYTDFLIPAYLVIALAKARIPLTAVWYVISIFAVFLWSVTLFSFGENYLLVNILSMMRLFRPVLLIPIGIMFVQAYGLQTVLKCVFRGSMLVATAIIASDIVFNPVFPNGLWGGEFLGQDVYGFPNSAAAFYSVLLFGIILGLYEGKTSKTLKYAAIGVAFLLVLTIFLSGSRSGMISAVILIVLSAMYHKLRGVVYLVAAAPVAILVATAVFDQETFRIIFIKFDRTFGSGDFSSGRIDIWIQTLYLIYERPIFGYGFFPFSNFSSFDTPHNQYLELAYKSGVLGLIVFLAPLVVVMVRSLRSQSRPLYLFGSLLVALGVSCVTQPNLSFTPTANFVFLLTGVVFAVSYQSRVVRSRSISDRAAAPVAVSLQPEVK